MRGHAVLMLLLLGAALIEVGLGDSFNDYTLCCQAYANLVNTALNNVIDNAVNSNANCGGADGATTTAAPTTTTATPTSTTTAPPVPGSFDDNTLCCKAYDNLLTTAVSNVIDNAAKANADCGGADAPTTTAAPTNTITAPPLSGTFADDTVCCATYNNLVKTAINYVIDNANAQCGGTPAAASSAAPTNTPATPTVPGSFSDNTVCCAAYQNLLKTGINYIIDNAVSANAKCGGGSATATTTAASPSLFASTTSTAAPITNGGSTTATTPTVTTPAPTKNIGSTTSAASPTTTTAATTASDPCASSPCQHSGTCVPNGTTYTCNCPALFSTPTGNNCQYFYCDYLAKQGGGNVAITLGKLNNQEGYCANVGSTTYFVFQRRQDGSVNFTRNWADYANGFGNPSGEFWFGLSYLSQLLSYTQWILHIELTNQSGAQTYAEYGDFTVEGPATNYTLSTLGVYSGTAVDGMSYQNYMQFSTPDADHDDCTCNCAQAWKGGWWFNDCHRGYLNGVYGSSTPSLGINWVPTDTPAGSASYAYSYPKAAMMIRPAA